MWTNLDNKLIDAYVILIMGNRRTIDDVATKYKSEVELRIAEKTITILENK